MIVDDASLVSEADLIQAALRFGCQRLILLGNERLIPEIFSVQPMGREGQKSRTLFQRVADAYKDGGHANMYTLEQLKPSKKAGKEVQPKASAKPSARKSKSKAAQIEESKQEEGANEARAPHITFVNVSEGQESRKKESYINPAEAEALVDYYVACL